MMNAKKRRMVTPWETEPGAGIKRETLDAQHQVVLLVLLEAEEVEGSVNVKKQSEGLKVSGGLRGAMTGSVIQDKRTMNAKTRRMVTP